MFRFQGKELGLHEAYDALKVTNKFLSFLVFIAMSASDKVIPAFIIFRDLSGSVNIVSSGYTIQSIFFN